MRLVEIPESPVGSMGFCAALGSLFVQGSGPQGYGLYRMTDAEGDGTYESVRSSRTLAKAASMARTRCDSARTACSIS